MSKQVEKKISCIGFTTHPFQKFPPTYDYTKYYMFAFNDENMELYSLFCGIICCGDYKY